MEAGHRAAHAGAGGDLFVVKAAHNAARVNGVPGKGARQPGGRDFRQSRTRLGWHGRTLAEDARFVCESVGAGVTGAGVTPLRGPGVGGQVGLGRIDDLDERLERLHLGARREDVPTRWDELRLSGRQVVDLNSVALSARHRNARRLDSAPPDAIGGLLASPFRILALPERES